MEDLMAIFYNESCIFCSIIEKKIKAEIIEENEDVLAFKDINPQARFHVLIVPKIHVKSVNELNKEHEPYLSAMILLAKKLASTFNFADDGYRLVINTGARAGQSVFHIHLHLLAGREFSWPPG
jgi:histidine triad (HIT) family protein